MKKFVLVLLLILFIIFIIIFCSSKTNYYEYANHKKVLVTNEKILEFEKDINEGKNVNLNDYIKDESKDYSNNLTKVGDFISNNIFNVSEKVVKISYNFISKVIGF
jgi:anionic cell wall polymer biosynthesis LytR-Cps2A-Psr (LCP) family protein